MITKTERNNYEMDVFMEQVVTKTPTRRDKILEAMAKVSAFAFAFALCFASIAYFTFIAPLAIFIGVFFIWLSFKLSKRLSVEYEYTFTNGELDVDKIIAKSKRKRLCSVHIGSLTAFGKWNDDMLVEADSTMIIASDNSPHAVEYYMDFKYGDYGNTTLFISPNERLLGLMEPYLPREIRKEFQKNFKAASEQNDE